MVIDNEIHFMIDKSCYLPYVLVGVGARAAKSLVCIGLRTWRELVLIKLYERSCSRVQKEQIQCENATDKRGYNNGESATSLF